MVRSILLLASMLSLHTQAQFLDARSMELPYRPVGTWEGEVDGMQYTEQWRAAGPRTYEGEAHMRKAGQMLSEERMRITHFADQWLFIASTGGARITSFVRVEEKDGAWVFENREHDFPQRIGYRVEGDTLRAYIALLDDQGQRIDFVLRRGRSSP